MAIPLASPILPDTINGFTKWQFYVNVLILIIYFSIDYSQTHSVKRIADITDYWRLKDNEWIPHNNIADPHQQYANGEPAGLDSSRTRRHFPASS